MAIIKSPNKGYTGVSASVAFCNGEGKTDNKHLIGWFKDHGYEVIEEVEKEDAKVTPENEGEAETKELIDMTVEALTAYAKEKGIDIGNSTSQKGILKKIQDAEAIKE